LTVAAMADPFARCAAALERCAAALERLADTRPPRPAMLEALREAFGQASFTAAEAITLAEEQAAEAAALGQTAPDLPAALAGEGIRSPHALGRRLAKLGARRLCREGGGTLWIA
jgi:hypothetical protein